MQSNSNQQPQKDVYSYASMHRILNRGIQSISFSENETQNRLVQSQPNILSINQELQQERKKRSRNSKTRPKIYDQLFNSNKSENFKTPKKSLSKNNSKKSKSNQNQIFNNLSKQKTKTQVENSTQSSHKQSRLILIRPNFPDKSRERADKYRQTNRNQSELQQGYYYLEQTCTDKLCMVNGNGLCIQHCRVDKEAYINEFQQRPFPFQILLQYRISEEDTVNSENYPSQLENGDVFENMGDQQFLDSLNQIPNNNETDQQTNSLRSQQVQIDQYHQNNPDQNVQQRVNPFPLSMQFKQFKLQTDFHYFLSHDFVQPTTLNYSTRYELRHLWQYYGRNHNQGLKIKLMDKLSLICLNCDFNIQGKRIRRKRKQYFNTSQQRRAKELVEIIIQAMNNNIDFILLQQICHETMRFQLLQAVQQWNQKIQYDLRKKIHTKKCQYYYPDNLFKAETYPSCMNFRTTMILTRHQVKFGQLKFYIPVIQKQQQEMVRLPIQAFCQFEIKIEGQQRYEKVCILSCHLISNGATYSTATPKELRRKQIECFQHMSRNYGRFFCIGDTNIPSSDFFIRQNQDILQIFADATTSLRSQVRGTYLFLRDSGDIANERLDRVWMKKKNEQSTAVQIKYRDEELDACRNQGKNRQVEFARNDNTLLYISPTDHTILDITIQFVE